MTPLDAFIENLPRHETPPPSTPWRIVRRGPWHWRCERKDDPRIHHTLRESIADGSRSCTCRESDCEHLALLGDVDATFRARPLAVQDPPSEDFWGNGDDHA